MQVIQQRVDALVDFNRNWTQYENGFGDLLGNFWLGLQNMYTLTTSGTYKAIFEVTQPSGTVGYACYDDFALKDAAAKYALVTVHGFNHGSPLTCRSLCITSYIMHLSEMVS